MNKGLIFTFAFAIGAATGSVVTWKLIKDKYEHLAREEVKEVRAYYSEKGGEVSVSVNEPDKPATNLLVESTKEDERMEYSSIASMYTNDEGGDKPMSRREPYVISPAEFGADDAYDTLTLIYYNDGILADHDGNRIEDIEACIGYESLNHFGEYGGDSVYVRNDDTMMDYEVLLDETNYADLDGVD